MVKTHTFNRRKYLITIEPLDGWCNQFKKERELIVMRGMGTRIGLETLIHESLHACDWHASEENVTQTAHDIARFLWRLGYRKSTKK